MSQSDNRDFVFLEGVAGTGKTELLLDEYRDALVVGTQAAGPGRTLWLTPSRNSRQTVLQSLFEGRLKGCFRPNVFTFEAFAEQILRDSGQQVALISSGMQRALLRRIISDLHSSHDLVYYRGIAHTSGFLDTVLSLISELKRIEVWPEDFARMSAGYRENRRDRELAGIYDRYQSELQRLGLYDHEGRFWSARSVIREHGLGPFSNLQLVIADGFADFTQTQYEILCRLAKETVRMVVSLPGESIGNRQELFATPIATREKIEAMLKGSTPIHIQSAQPTSQLPLPAVRHLAEHLFGNPRQIPLATDATGLEILEVHGRANEIPSLAFRVKQLLLSGVPAENIVVVFRRIGADVRTIISDFTQAGVPVSCERGERLSGTPLVRGLRAVLQLEQSNWEFDSLMSLLHSSYFRPDWPEIDLPASIASVSATLRMLKLSGDRQGILDVIRIVCERDAESDAANRSPRENEAAQGRGQSAQLLGRLSDALQPLRESHTLEGWAKTLLAVARELGMAYDAMSTLELQRDDVAPDPLNLRDLDLRDTESWTLIERILFDAARLDQGWSTHQRQLSLSSFRRELDELLGGTSLSPARNSAGCVRILEAAQARNIHVDYLFVAGLTEDSFPSRHQEDCLYGEGDRQELSAHGVRLRKQDAHNADEMLLFYSVITRARRGLVLSYASVNSAGQPLFPSPYVQTLIESFQKGVIQRTPIGRLDPVPDSDHLLTESDLRVTATLHAIEKDPGLFSRLLERPELAGTLRNIVAAAESIGARTQTSGFTGYEGLITHPRHRAMLQQMFAADHEFSVSRLETYAECPFKFLLRDVLHIQPQDSPVIATDRLFRGSILHRVLLELHRSLAETEDIYDHELLTTRFRELADRELSRQPINSPLQRAMLEVERRVLHIWASRFADQSSRYVNSLGDDWSQPPRPTYLELPFGRAPDEGEDRSAYRLPAIEFGEGPERTRLQGRIDRVDVGQNEGRPAFLVIDYKSGNPKRFKTDSIADGKTLQLAVYLVGLEQSARFLENATPFQTAYWSITADGYVAGLSGTGGRRQPPALNEEQRQEFRELLQQVVPRLAAGIRRGDFPVASQDKDCTKYCPYDTVCRITDLRPLAVPRAKLWNPATGQPLGDAP